MLTQEPIYKPPSIFCFKPILLSAHKLILLIYVDNTAIKNLMFTVAYGTAMPTQPGDVYQGSKFRQDTQELAWSRCARVGRCSSLIFLEAMGRGH